ncbi:MAG: hypothetical protein WDN49_24860 [Acetobacteraceae bacterium]
MAERIQAFNAAGIETFMLQFQPFEAEMRRFAQAVNPAGPRAASPQPCRAGGPRLTSHAGGHSVPSATVS